MTNDELLSKTIYYLRFPLTVGVVFIHFSLAEGLNIHGVKHGLGNPDWFFFIVNIISEVLARTGVPLFFVISGFLFFYRKDFNSIVYYQKLKSRARTLLIPFVLWNVIAIIWQLKCFIPVISNYYRPVEVHVTFVRIINTFFCNVDNSGIIVGPLAEESSSPFPINIPLWYVRDLIVMVMISPIICWLIKKGRALFVIFVGFSWFFDELFLPKASYSKMFVTALFFFSWGGYYSVNKKNIVIMFRKMKLLPFIYVFFAIADVLTKGMTIHGYIHKSGILIGVIAVVNIASYLLKSNKVQVNSTLAKSSFFIFAFHGIFISDVGKFLFIMLHIPENNPIYMLTLYFAVPIIAIIFCLTIYFFLCRYFPKASNLLTGGR